MATLPLTRDSTVNRWIDLETPLDSGILVAERVKGAETLGRLFEYELMALSERHDVDFDALLGEHVSIGLELSDAAFGVRRFIDGRVAQISLVGMADNLFRYRIVLRPWLWMLTRTADCRIFQNRNVRQIIEDVFADQADADFDFRLSRDYIEREYCVQYRETDFNFVSRLMEEEGIYYFFEHENGKHTLVICDAPGAHESVGPLPYRPQGAQVRGGEAYVKEWSVTREIQPVTTVLRDYNFETPKVDLTVRRGQDREHSEATHEWFDYPGEYPDADEGEHLVLTRLEEIQAAHELIEGAANARKLACGALFGLTEFIRADQNQEYLIVRLAIEATNNLPERDQRADFECRFQLIPSEVTYRSPRATRRPTVQGPQTAEVVGPAGEEIHVDEYGRVKVQFHWDRLGEHDENSSCWVRVSQIWAGKNYGWMTIPRIGQEVIVDFLEGDADRPIITGRVYNADQMPPWDLPDNKTQSGILTRSSQSGSPDTANQLRFEDKKGDEQIYLHAEKNMDRHIEHDDSTYVGNDKILTVERDQRNNIKRDRWEVVERDQHLAVSRDRVTNIKNNEVRVVDVDQNTKIGANQVLNVIGNQDATIDGNQTLSVKGNITSNTPSNRTTDTGGDEKRSVGGNQVFSVGGTLSYKAPTMVFEAGHIDFKVTGASSHVLECPVGPYQMMVNRLDVISNTDINLFGVGAINAVSMDNNTTIMGNNNGAYVGMASDVMMAIARNTFIGLQMDTALAVSINNFVGAQMENALAIRMETAAGVNIEMNTLKTLLPGGGGGGGGAAAPGTMSQGASAAAAFVAVKGIMAGLGSFGVAIAEQQDQYKTAQSQLRSAAAAAEREGHPNLANRLRALASGQSIGGSAESTGGGGAASTSVPSSSSGPGSDGPAGGGGGNAPNTPLPD